MNSPFFFFSGEITPERLAWLQTCVGLVNGRDGTHIPVGKVKNHHVRLFLTGDALMSLADARTEAAWSALSTNPMITVVADGEELRLHGLGSHVRSQFPGIKVPGNGDSPDKGSFWQALVQAARKVAFPSDKAAFLLCHSPYMSRTPVYMLRFLKSAVEAGQTPELYSYLDGVHAAHREQRPSEFENIGEGILALSTVAGGSGEDPWFGACSRCATARGYYMKNPLTGGCEPVSYLDAVAIRPLKEILDRFRGNHPILACNSCSAPAAAGSREAPGDQPPVLVILITCTPYVSEWTFGGLSMAVAAAMGGIPTSVVFIEQGVYAICGNHEVAPEDRVFNVQEMLEATSDIPDLRYYVCTEALRERGLTKAESLAFVSGVDGKELGVLLGIDDGGPHAHTVRTIFF